MNASMATMLEGATSGTGYALEWKGVLGCHVSRHQHDHGLPTGVVGTFQADAGMANPVHNADGAINLLTLDPGFAGVDRLLRRQEAAANPPIPTGASLSGPLARNPRRPRTSSNLGRHPTPNTHHALQRACTLQRSARFFHARTTPIDKGGSECPGHDWHP